jgi:hypothetical protein
MKTQQKFHSPQANPQEQAFVKFRYLQKLCPKKKPRTQRTGLLKKIISNRQLRAGVLLLSLASFVLIQVYLS